MAETGAPGSRNNRMGPLKSIFVRRGDSLVSLVETEGTTGRDGGCIGVLEIGRGSRRKV